MFDELVGFSEEFTGKDGDGSGTITDFLILSLGDVDQDLGGGVVDVDRSEDSGTIVSDGDLIALGASAGGDENFVLRRKYSKNSASNALTIPLGPRVVFMRSAIAIAPTKED